MNRSSDKTADRTPAGAHAGSVHGDASRCREKESSDLPACKLKFVAYYDYRHDAPSEQMTGRDQSTPEWTAIIGAEPQFSGHYQPRLPAHDLLDELTLEKQIGLAK